MGNFLGFFILKIEWQRQFISLNGRTIIASADEFLQSKMIEMKSEVFEEVAFVRVIAVAEHGLALKVRPIMLQLPLYVGQLRVKFILLGRFGCVQVLVCHNK